MEEDIAGVFLPSLLLYTKNSVGSDFCWIGFDKFVGQMYMHTGSHQGENPVIVQEPVVS